jgi:hypothetical protein
MCLELYAWLAGLPEKGMLGIRCLAFLCVAILSGLASSEVSDSYTQVEYLGLLGNGQGPKKDNGPFKADWVEVTYPDRADFVAANVSMRRLPPNEGEALVGDWRHADLSASGAMLTGRIFKDNLYVLINKGFAPIARGCCADSLRIFPRSGGYRDILIVRKVKHIIERMENVRFFGISHAPDVVLLDGSVHLLLPVLYYDDTLNGRLTDGVLAMNVDTLDYKPTVDGHIMFSCYRAFGTLDTSPEASVFNVQYVLQKGDGQQWHMNCIQTFVTKDGTAILGLTLRMDVEALLIKDPWKYSIAQGGGKVLQKFGSPHIYDADAAVVGRHDFGLSHEDFFPLVPGNPMQNLKANGGLHNMFYYRHSDGRETVTLFCNQVNNANRSAVFEFDVRLVHDQNVKADDSVFKTNYKKVVLPYSTMSQGGARPIGDGVYLVTSGIADQGVSCVDTSGGITFYNYSYKLLYDPFVFLRAPRKQGTVRRQSISNLGAESHNISYMIGIVSLVCVVIFVSLVGKLRRCAAKSEENAPYMLL